MKPFLTKRQRQILDYVQRFSTEQGVAPTHREICEEFGYSSYGTVYKHLKLLREKGYLRGGWNQKRGIEVTNLDSLDESTLAERAGRTELVGEVPYLGKIAAGRPIEAVPNPDHLAVPHHLLARETGRHYVLRVDGSSMIEEGIHDGDFVIVLEREEAQSGEMVVALVDGEVTLKRFFPEGPKIRLQPSNREMKPLFVDAERLRVQGVVVGLMRKY